MNPEGDYFLNRHYWQVTLQGRVLKVIFREQDNLHKHSANKLELNHWSSGSLRRKTSESTIELPTGKAGAAPSAVGVSQQEGHGWGKVRVGTPGLEQSYCHVWDSVFLRARSRHWIYLNQARYNQFSTCLMAIQSRHLWVSIHLSFSVPLSLPPFNLRLLKAIEHWNWVFNWCG